jgi:hypothetical protein
MSLDIFLHCFRNGEPATFARSLFNDVFGVTEDTEEEPGFLDVRYPDGSAAEIYVDEGDIQNIMFNHCGGATFWEKLFELARVTESVIFWPEDDNSAVVANPAAVKHLPADFSEGKDIQLVHSASELEARIFAGEALDED